MVYVLEFCGIPGSGKTTICKKLKEYLLEDGYSVCDFSDYYTLAVQKRGWKVKLLLNIHHYFPIIKDLFNILCLIPSHTVYDLKYCHFIFNNIVAYKCLYDDLKTDIILMDEFILQYEFSLFYNRPIKSINPLISLIYHTFQNQSRHIYVNIDSNNENILYRIGHRSGGMSRLDKEDKENREQIINIQRTNLHSLLDHFDGNCKINVMNNAHCDLTAKTIYLKYKSLST